MNVSENKVLSAEDIVAKATPKHPPLLVQVPEWGGSVYVRRLSVGDLGKYFARINELNGHPDKIRVAALSSAICDENGNRLFTESDASALVDLDAAGYDRVMLAFTTENRMNTRGN